MANSTTPVAPVVAQTVDKVGKKKKKTNGQGKFRRWALHRNEGGEWKRCYWHDAESGTREQSWDAAELPPSPALIAARWGSGVYKLTKLSEANKVAGSVALPAIDSRKHPTRPLYPNPPGEEPAPKPKQQAPTDAWSAVLASAGVGGQQLQAMLQGIELYQRIDFTARNFAMQEAEQRVQRYLAEAESARMRERQWFEMQLKQQEKFYGALTEAKRDPSEDLDERLEEIREELSRGTADDEDDGDVKTMFFRTLKKKIDDIPGEDVGALVAGVGDWLKDQKAAKALKAAG